MIVTRRYNGDSFLVIKSGRPAGEYIDFCPVEVASYYKSGYGIVVKGRIEELAFSVNDIVFSDLFEAFFSRIYDPLFFLNYYCGESFHDARYQHSFFSLNSMASLFDLLTALSRLVELNSADPIEFSFSRFYYSKRRLLDFLETYASFLKPILDLNNEQFVVCVFGP